jgi:hypothetical protein
LVPRADHVVVVLAGRVSAAVSQTPPVQIELGKVSSRTPPIHSSYDVPPVSDHENAALVATPVPAGEVRFGAAGTAAPVTVMEAGAAHGPVPLAFVPRTAHVVDVPAGSESAAVVQTPPVQIELAKVSSRTPPIHSS